MKTILKTPLRILGILCVTLSLINCSSDDSGETITEFNITSISPETGMVGTQVTLRGSNFPSEASDIDISFDGTTASIISASSTQIITSVPVGGSSGEVEVEANGFAKVAPSNFTVLSELVTSTVQNLEAPQTGGQGQPIGGPFTKFSFATGAVTDSETDWDIAFRGTTIAVNGGVATGTAEEPVRNGNAGIAIENGIFSELTSAAGITYLQDADGSFAVPQGSDEGWYNYNPATFTVTPIPGKILVIRTHDGYYAKVEILSYYRDAPAQPDALMDESRVYTFNYVYNPNQGETSL